MITIQQTLFRDKKLYDIAQMDITDQDILNYNPDILESVNDINCTD